MASKKRTLHLMEASMRFDRSDAETKEAFKWQMEQNPDIVFLTEATNFHDALRQACRGTDYRPVFTGNRQSREGAFYTKLPVKDHGARKVHPGTPGPAHQGGHTPRFIYWIHTKWEDEDVFYHGAHWVTKWSENELRDQRHERTTKLMCEEVKKHGAGRNLSFFSGDQNVNEQMDNKAKRSQVDDTFRDNGLLTIWDEMNVFPPTHGLAHGPTIDIIGSYNPDKRVKATRWKVYAKHASDHRPISAWYEVTPKKGTNVGGNTGGGSTNPTPKKGFIHGGNVDFSDYADGRVYDLPMAVDDSDLTNG